MSNDTFEMSTGEAHEFAMACGRNGLTRADIKILSTGSNLRRSLDFLNGSVSAETKAAGVFVINVDYAQSLAAMIKAGTYDWTNSDITEKRFPVKGEGVVERMLTLHHYDRAMDSSDVVKDLDSIGKEPVPIEDLLAFGAQFPEEQRKYPIIALGSSAEVLGNRNVPCLVRDDSRRSLHLSWYGGGWNENCRFLARHIHRFPALSLESAGFFCKVCRRQPPSMRPASATCPAICAYCPVLKDFVSVHKRRSNFKRSTRAIHLSISDNFSDSRL